MCVGWGVGVVGCVGVGWGVEVCLGGAVGLWLLGGLLE